MAVTSARRPGVILARMFVFAFAAAAIFWTLSVAPMFWSDATVAQVATRIIAGEVYKPEIIEALQADIDRHRVFAFRSSILSKVAIIRLRSAENAIAAGDQKIIDESLNSLGKVVDDALINAPSDAFQWLVLFWLDNTRNGFKPEHIPYLQMSYFVGPYEGSIAIKRSRIATSFFPATSTDLAQMIVSEFVGLVRSGLSAEAADILSGPAWQIRYALLTRLKDLKFSDRQAFAKILYDRNLDDVPVPGIEQQSLRPWRRNAR